MKVTVKRYNNDVSKAYKTLMRKLNKEGHYTEIKRNEFFVSKSEAKREAKKAGIKRQRKADIKREELLVKLEKKASQVRKRPYQK